MIRPLPPKPISKLPITGKHPDPERVEGLFRLGDKITELAAHLAAGTCQLLELIQVFDQEGGWCFPGIRSSATAPALLYLLRPCSRAPTG